MAKKKLSDYQKARRQFVQQRAATVSGDVTKQQKQQFRQRFDVLASTKQGRTQLAQRALPTGGPEERKDYKRMLATELPARKDLGKTTPTTPTTGLSYTADQIARMRVGAATMGPQLSQIAKPPSGSFGATQKVGSYTGPSLKTSSKSKFPTVTNPVAQKISKGLQAVVPGLSDVAQARKELDKGNVVGGLGRLALGTAQTAATVASLFGFGGGTAAKGPTPIKSGTGPGKLPPRPKPPVRSPNAPKLPTPPKTPKVPKTPKTPKTPPAKTAPAKTAPAKTAPAKTAPAKTAPAKTAPAKTAPAKTAPAKTAPAKTAPAKTAPAKTAPAKTAPAKTAPAKTAAAKEKPLSKSAAKKAEDTKLSLGIRQQKYPKAGEKDLDFILRVENAQDIVTNQKQNWYQYSQWLQSSQTQARLRALRGK